MLRHLLRVDDKHVASALVDRDRLVGDEEPAPAGEGQAHADKETGHDDAVRVRKDRAQLHSAGRGIGPVAHVVDLADPGEAVVGVERPVRLVTLAFGCHRLTAPAERAVDEDLALAHVEVGIDRVLAHDRSEERRLAGADEVPDVDVVAVDAPAVGRVDVGVGEVELRRVEVGLRLRDRRARLVARLGLLHQIGLAAGIALKDRLRDLELLRGRLGLRLSALEIGRRLVDTGLVKARLDDEQGIALFDVGARREVHALEEPLHACPDLDRLDGDRPAGDLVVRRHLLLDREGDGDLRRRGRSVLVASTGGHEDGESQRVSRASHRQPRAATTWATSGAIGESRGVCLLRCRRPLP